MDEEDKFVTLRPLLLQGKASVQSSIHSMVKSPRAQPDS